MYDLQQHNFTIINPSLQYLGGVVIQIDVYYLPLQLLLQQYGHDVILSFT